MTTARTCDPRASLATAAVAGCFRGALRIPGVRTGIESLACRAGRREPLSRRGGVLIYHTREALRRLGDDRVRFARVAEGAEVAVQLNEYLWQFIYFRGCFERETTQFFRRFLHPGDVVLDVGANAGYFTMIATRLVGPGGRVYAFEPNPRAAVLLRASVAHAQAEALAVVEPIALASHVGHVTLHLPTDGGDTGQASMVSGWVDSATSVEVEAQTLDHYCDTHRIDSIRLLKIDVEGAEADVLQGGVDVMARVRPNATVCEFVTGRNVPAQERVLDFFRGHRYLAYKLGLQGELQPHPMELPTWSLDGFGSVLTTEVGAGNLCFVPAELAP